MLCGSYTSLNDKWSYFGIDMNSGGTPLIQHESGVNAEIIDMYIDTNIIFTAG